MNPCGTCPRRLSCRVPGDLVRFDAVAHRLESQRRLPVLRQRLNYFMEHQECLVEAGYVEQ